MVAGPAARPGPKPTASPIHPTSARSAAAGALGGHAQHLREITPADIATALDPLPAPKHCIASNALRSLFHFARKRGLIFTDPTRRLTLPTIEPGLLPMTEDEIGAVTQLTTTLLQRLAVALAAVHATRPAAIRPAAIRPAAIRSLTLAGHHQRMGDLPHRALMAWLEHRCSTWPLTPNRHVVICNMSALGHAPISRSFLKTNLA
ncbi:hypothetical protein [Actinomadura sp. 3N407]|uniref:hypothetical protein n=1 Tax=Actinomadura sp. 3N407 TaxID=3457423 RepID=UPI003FCEE07D